MISAVVFQEKLTQQVKLMGGRVDGHLTKRVSFFFFASFIFSLSVVVECSHTGDALDCWPGGQR